MHLSEEETVAATTNSSGRMSSSCPTRTASATWEPLRHLAILTRAVSGAEETGMLRQSLLGRAIISQRRMLDAKS